MNKATIIFMVGPSATGKTTIGKILSEHFNLSFISKDDIKEIIFDTLGYSDREWSKKVGASAFRIQDYFIESQLNAGNSFVIDGAFNRGNDDGRLKAWQDTYKFTSVQILCQTKKEIRYERFVKRAESGERHPGHDDLTTIKELKVGEITESSEPFELKGELIELDTTNFDSVDIGQLVQKVDRALNR